LSGVYRPDEGSIRLAGAEVSPSDPRAAQHLGIAIIHQELNQVPELTVAENFFLGRERRNAFGVPAAARVSGEIRIDDRPVRLRSPVDAIARGIGFVTEDRKGGRVGLAHSGKRRKAAEEDRARHGRDHAGQRESGVREIRVRIQMILPRAVLRRAGATASIQATRILRAPTPC
jgi:ABC-type sugar transport system ATPase subunit